MSNLQSSGISEDLTALLQCSMLVEDDSAPKRSRMEVDDEPSSAAGSSSSPAAPEPNFEDNKDEFWDEDNHKGAMTAEQKAAMRAAIRNPLILQEIIKKLDSVPELLTCRLVGQSWFRFSSEHLLLRDLTVVTIVCDPMTKILRRSCQFALVPPTPPPPPNKRTSRKTAEIQSQSKSSDQLFGPMLKELSDILAQKNANFPCSHFIFKLSPLHSDLGSGQARRFFETFGYHLKILELIHELPAAVSSSGLNNRQLHVHKPVVSMTARKSFVQLLNEWVPNVTKLTVQNFDYGWPELSSSSENGDENSKVDILTLPNLTHFGWRGRHSDNLLYFPPQNPGQTTPFQILRGAPNLKEIENVSLHTDLDLVVQSGKIHAIKKLDLRNQWLATLSSDLASFVEAGGRLETLHCIVPIYIRNPWIHLSALMTSIEQLIEVSADTLTFLDLGNLRFKTEDADQPENQLLPPFKLPSLMPRLKKLRVASIHNGKASRCLPPGTEATVFPNLEILEFPYLGWHEREFAADAVARAFGGENVDDDSRCAAAYFPSSLDKLPSVRTLIMSTAACKTYYMKKLCHLCPKFKNLVLSYYEPGNFYGGLRHVIKYGFRLERLRVIMVNGHPNQFRFANLDSVFAGLTRSDLDSWMSQSNFNIYNVRPLLLRLRGLQRIEIAFKGSCAKALSEDFEAQSFSANRPISSLSAQFAFNLMPNLTVVLEYDQNCKYSEGVSELLESIAPFVNLANVHSYLNEPISIVRE